jgi:maltooligosyltrehalose trehalohydrolase
VLEDPGQPLRIPLEPEADGYFSTLVEQAQAGMRYHYALDGQESAYPDPASRFQPEGPHGPSQVVDPGTFLWTDATWQGLCLEGQVIYEMHIGTFTPAGTWTAATTELSTLATSGITVIELMPVADFVGRFGWGYDGVNLFAPTRLYGTPDDFRRFVDQAHALGMGVILDVVYNHLGPDGNYLACFAEDYFTDRYQTDWGQAINFDGDQAEHVRAFFLANASYWIDEFHLDGFRFDATQNIYDASEDHILAALVRQARHAARGRSLMCIAENEPQHVKLVQTPEQGGYGLDALWNDDFHHSAMALLTGHHEAYYTDYRGTPQEFISAIKWGYLYQGQWYTWQKQRRGTPTFGLTPATFVLFIQNHDQIANSARSLRCHALCSPGRYRAMTALMLLAPATPMLFQGQEFAASSPFFYFADHRPELAELVYQGRQEFMKQFRTLSMSDKTVMPPNPADPETFARCKLDLAERQQHAEVYALHCDLLHLRRTDPVFRVQLPRGVDGAVLAPEAFVLRFFANDGEDRLLIVNFGLDYHLNPAPEPLLAPPLDRLWRILWSSEDPRYGGDGTAPLDTEENWCIPGQAAVVLAPCSAAE